MKIDDLGGKPYLKSQRFDSVKFSSQLFPLWNGGGRGSENSIFFPEKTF